MRTKLDLGEDLGKKWKVLGLLRRTETSQAFLAEHRNGSFAVLRVLHEHLCEDEVLAARFRREAYVANTIPHPAVIMVLDDLRLPDGRTMLVTERVEGESMEDIRVAFGGRLPPDLAIDLLVQVLDVLECAHTAGIVHRNLRPDLVLVHHGQVKIADFGFARLVHSNEELTDVGLVLGVPQFISPEQARGHRDLVDAQSDVYAVGAMAFLLLSGHGVHPAETPEGFLHPAKLAPARSLRSVVSDDLVDDDLVRVIDKALAVRKAERWLSAAELATALREVLARRVVEPNREAPIFDVDEVTLTMLLPEERDLLQRALSFEPEAPTSSSRSREG